MDFKSGYIITSKANQKKILEELSLDNTFYNYKFLTLEALKQKLTFSIKKEAYFKVSRKFNLPISVVAYYFKSLMSLNGYFIGEKALFLKSIYDYLEKENLLIIDDIFKIKAQEMHFTFFGYEKTKELDYILTLLSHYEVKDVIYPLSIKEIDVLTFSKFEYEIAYVFKEIISLIKQGVLLDDIKIVNLSADDSFTFNRYAKSYGIKIKSKASTNFLQTELANTFFTLAKQEKLPLVLEKLGKVYDLDAVNQLINLINQYGISQEDVNSVVDIYEYLFRQMTFMEKEYENTLELITPNEIDSYLDKHLFFLDFNLGIPHIIKDEDYLTDKDKVMLKMDLTNELNILNKKHLVNNLLKAKHLTITFSYLHSFKTAIISPLVKEKPFKEVIFNGEYPFGLNKINDDLNLALSCDNLIKYNELSNMLVKYYYEELPYLKYNNKYKVKDINKMKSLLKSPLTLSYTDMHSYLDCPFSYYLKKILKIDEFEVTLDTILGGYAHYLLEAFELKKDTFNLDNESDIYINNLKENNTYPLENKDYYYLNKMKENISFVIEEIKKHKQNTRLDQVVCEKKMDVVSDKLIFKGFIDKLWYKEQDGITYVAIIDYKTGSDKASLKDLEFGQNLQLPIYIYLLRNNSRFKNSKLVGFYLQKINIFNPKREVGKSAQSQKVNNVLLEGYTNSELVDYIDFTEEKNYLKKFRLKKDGTPYSSSLVFNEDDENEIMDLVQSKILECEKGINEANFKIVSKLINQHNVSCTYCHFKDVCFKTIDDNLYLESEKEKEDLEDADE